MSEQQTLTVVDVQRSKYNDQQIRVKDHLGRWLSGWDAQLLNMRGKEIDAVVKTVQKGDKTYYNLHTFCEITDSNPAAQRPAPSVQPAERGGDKPFASARSMEILIQTCLKEVVAVNGLDGCAAYAVAMARQVAMEAQRPSPERETAIRDMRAATQELDHAAQQAADDDDIPF